MTLGDGDTVDINRLPVGGWIYGSFTFPRDASRVGRAETPRTSLNRAPPDAEASRGDAAAATWIFRRPARADAANRRRGRGHPSRDHDVDHRRTGRDAAATGTGRSDAAAGTRRVRRYVVEVRDTGPADSEPRLIVGKNDLPSRSVYDSTDWFASFYDFSDYHYVRGSAKQGETLYVGVLNDEARAKSAAKFTIKVELGEPDKILCLFDCNGQGSCDERTGDCVCDQGYAGAVADRPDTCQFEIEDLDEGKDYESSVRIGNWDFYRFDASDMAPGASLLVEFYSSTPSSLPLLVARRGDVPRLLDGWLPDLDTFVYDLTDADGFTNVRGQRMSILLNDTMIAGGSSKDWYLFAARILRSLGAAATPRPRRGHSAARGGGGAARRRGRDADTPRRQPRRRRDSVETVKTQVLRRLQSLGPRRRDARRDADVAGHVRLHAPDQGLPRGRAVPLHEEGLLRPPRHVRLQHGRVRVQRGPPLARLFVQGARARAGPVAVVDHRGRRRRAARRPRGIANWWSFESAGSPPHGLFRENAQSDRRKTYVS